MKIKLIGHTQRYAVEQAILMFFPGESIEFVDYLSGEDESFAEIAYSEGRTFASSRVFTQIKGKNALKRTRAKLPSREMLDADPFEHDRAVREVIKKALYLAARDLTGTNMPWGSLTGIRPAKVASRILKAGNSPDVARKILVKDYFLLPDRADMCVKCAQWAEWAESGLDLEETREGVRTISLYVGIPFCPTRCAYCSFVSHAIERAGRLVEPYIEALLKEIEASAHIVRELGLRVKTVYFGGGTPTSLNPGQLDAILSSLERHFDLSRVTEYTVEAGRPDTITPEKLAVLRQHGVDRVSVNPQSMDDRVLSLIGRPHTSEDIRRAFETARRAGFEIINSDLIAGLPGDTPQGFMRSLREIMDFNPENITVHTLSIKKGSYLAQENRELPSADEVGEMLGAASDALYAEGYAPYYLYRQKYMSGSFENAGWQKAPQSAGQDGRRDSCCLYNLYIMNELHTILSLGAGGVTKLVSPDRSRISRLFNAKYPREYIESIDRIIENKEKIRDNYANMI